MEIFLDVEQLPSLTANSRSSSVIYNNYKPIERNRIYTAIFPLTLEMVKNSKSSILIFSVHGSFEK